MAGAPDRGLAVARMFFWNRSKAASRVVEALPAGPGMRLETLAEARADLAGRFGGFSGDWKGREAVCRAATALGEQPRSHD